MQQLATTNPNLRRRAVLIGFALLALFSFSSGCSESDSGSPTGGGATTSDFSGTWSISSTVTSNSCAPGSSVSLDGLITITQAETDAVFRDGDGNQIPGQVDGRTVTFIFEIEGAEIGRISITLGEDGESFTGTGVSNEDNEGTPCAVGFDLTGTRTSTEVDTTPPTVSSRSPGENATGIAVATVIDVTFSEAIDAERVDDGRVHLNGPSGAVGVAISMPGPNRIRLTPSADLANSTTYTVGLDGELRDLVGNQLGSDLSWDFTTASAPAPTVVSTSPVANASNVRTDAEIRVNFSKAINAATVNNESFIVSYPDNGRVYGNFSVSGSTVTLTPFSPMQAEKRYTVEFNSRLEDTEGNGFASTFSFSFDSVPFMGLISVVPSDEAAEVRIDAPLVMTFNQDVDAATVDDNSIEITANTWVENRLRPEIAGSYTVSGRTVTFVPEGGLWQEYATGFRVNFNSGVTSTTGSPLNFSTPDANFTTVFFDPAYDYRLHNERSDLSSTLDTYSGTYEAFMELTNGANTSGMSWRFEKLGDRYLMRNAYGGDTRALEAAGGISNAFLQTIPVPNVYSGQMWNFTRYNPREAGEIQRRGESPGNYYLQANSLPSDKVLGTVWDEVQGRYQVKVTQKQANIGQLWWFERRGRI